MGIRVTNISETKGKDVFTDKGLYCGKIEDIECDLNRFKVRSLIVNAVRGSYLTNMLGNKKGVIIPFSMVEAIGDIVIIKNIAGPVEVPEPAKDEPMPSEQPSEKPSVPLAAFE